MELSYSVFDDDLLPLLARAYADDYNTEGGSWTTELALRRLNQYYRMPDSHCLAQKADGEISGMAFGYFKCFDDMTVFFLEEILILHPYRGKGLGSVLLEEVVKAAKDRGSGCLELLTMNDEMHEHFYGKLGLSTSRRLVMKYLDF